MNMEITYPGGKRVRASYKDFTVDTDQSKKNGGEGAAPSPFDLFLMSLGTCTGYYVLSFCQARRLATEQLRVRLDIDRNEKTHMVEKIAVAIEIPPDYPEKYHEKLVQVAGKCTVKKHLESPPVIDIALHVQ